MDHVSGPTNQGAKIRCLHKQTPLLPAGKRGPSPPLPGGKRGLGWRTAQRHLSLSISAWLRLRHGIHAQNAHKVTHARMHAWD